MPWPPRCERCSAANLTRRWPGPSIWPATFARFCRPGKPSSGRRRGGRRAQAPRRRRARRRYDLRRHQRQSGRRPDDTSRRTPRRKSADAGAPRAGMASLRQSLRLCLYQQILPPSAKVAPPATGCATASTARVGRVGAAAAWCVGGVGTGARAKIGPTAGNRWAPVTKRLFVVEGRDACRVDASDLDRLRARLDAPDHGIEADARAWFQRPSRIAGRTARRRFVAGDRAELRAQIDWARRSLFGTATPPPPAFRDRIFYLAATAGPDGKIAFVYPGSGNDYPGMGRELAVQWPEVLRRQDAENERLRSQFVIVDLLGRCAGQAADSRQKIFGQVALGRPDHRSGAAVRRPSRRGHRLQPRRIGGAVRAAGLGRPRRDAPGDERLDAVRRRPDRARATPPAKRGSCRRMSRSNGRPASSWIGRWMRFAPPSPAWSGAYLLIINTPRECVVGGQRGDVAEVGRRLRCTLLPLPETSTVHCPVAREVAEAYRRLHLLPTTPPPNVRFYSTALGRPYELTRGQRRRRHSGAGAGRHRLPGRDRGRLPRRRPPFRGNGAGRVVYAHDRRDPWRPAASGALGLRSRARTALRRCCGCWAC